MFRIVKIKSLLSHWISATQILRLLNLIHILFKLLSVLHAHSWHSDLSLRLWGPWSLNVLTIFFIFLSVRGPARYKNTQCYFSVDLPRTVCAFVSLILDNILQQYVPRNTVSKFYWTWLPSLKSDEFCAYFHISICQFWPMKRCRLVSIVKSRTFLTPYEHGRTCFDHVLSNFSGFSWERTLFLKSACVNMVMQIQVQIGDTKRAFLLTRLRVLRIKKNCILREIPKTSFMIWVYFTKTIKENMKC